MVHDICKSIVQLDTIDLHDEVNKPRFFLYLMPMCHGLSQTFQNEGETRRRGAQGCWGGLLYNRPL